MPAPKPETPIRDWEIEKLVYQHVMGWRQIPRDSSDGFCDSGGPLPWLDADGRLAPDMKTNTIAGAWMVVERMIARGFWLDIREGGRSPISYYVSFAADSAVEGESAPRCICLAALSALGVETA